MIHPAVRELFESIGRQPALQDLLRRLREALREADGPPQRFSLSGLTPTAKALAIALLYRTLEHPLLVLVDGNKQAETLLEAATAFFDLLVGDRVPHKPLLLPALDVLPFQGLSPHDEINEQRAIGLWRMATGRVSIVITPIAAALVRTESREFYRQLALNLKQGEEVPFDDLAHYLDSLGYQRREPVEMVGEYSIRGGILDVFPAESSHPIRLEFFGDQIESMRRFDVETQRSVLSIKEAQLLPLVEYPKTRQLFQELAAIPALAESDRIGAAGEEFAGWEFWAPVARHRAGNLLRLAPHSLAILDEPEQIAGAAERLWKRLDDPEKASLDYPAERFYCRWEEFQSEASRLPALEVRELDVVGAAAAAPHGSYAVSTRPSVAFHGNMPVAVSEGRSFVEQGGRVVFFAASSGELERFADILQEYRVPFQLGIDSSETTPQYLAERAYMAGAVAGTFLVKGAIRRGCIFTDPPVALFGAEDLFDTSELVARPGRTKSATAAFTADIADLKPGDYVVHATHGVGRFLGVRTLAQGEQSGDFMLLEYAGESRLYVPLTRLDLVQKFRGAEQGAPSLDKLGGATWTKTKSRVKARMRDMADELLKLYAQRKMAEGFAFSPDSNWQREFEDAFEFPATKDQLQAVRDIKRDMESPHPMDRLLCGDVGFGKTEVAMRAAFKALGDGKQVAILAPTTVLTLQHYENFRRRFAAFPVKVDMLSRFRSAKEIKATLEEVAAGKVDIVIGTHRLLSKDVQWSDLGLLVVDEEQRFGVRHKERLKEMRRNIDVLTMSATPIPRTLHMSLLGLRDMSIIETPPKDRLSIHTVVAHFEPELIKTAIEQEIGRGGQVYYIHNRVETIFERAAFLQQLLPQVRLAVGHGQMGETELERVLLGFMHHECDVFVCTTIAENGLDIPLANTIVIENAERQGLSELYQLRGRVGRSNRRAYAYLLVPGDKELSDVARKRLAALKEFSDLGAGFKIAALDLELRGAGNLLGGEQHGHIEAVGFDTYIRLLEETVRELKGEEVPLEIHSTLNLGLDIRIPPEYIADETQRLRAYKRISDAHDAESAERLRAELQDRYGPVPEVVGNLLDFAIVKSMAEHAGVEVIDRRGGMLNVKFHEKARIDPHRLFDLVQQTAGAQFTPAGVLRLPMQQLDSPQKLLGYLRAVLAIPESAPNHR